MSKPLQEVAVQVSPADNVAVVKFGVEDGESVTLSDGAELSLKATNPGHRFALTEIPAGEFVRQYNQPIGTSQGIGAGEAVTPENMSNEIPVVRDLPDDLSTPAPEPSTARRTFQGFRRSDGRVGTRNFILIVPASMCASHESTTIATIAEYTLYTREKYPNVDGVVAIPHNKGCGSPDGSNLEVLMRTLENTPSIRTSRASSFSTSDARRPTSRSSRVA
jgi:altronate hydrolase